MLIQGVEQFYRFIKRNGWNQIKEVKTEPWGGKTCSLTTIDGSMGVLLNYLL
jgi:AraC family transcriptional regulator